MRLRSELLLIERALKKGWPIPPQSRADAIELVQSVLADADSTVREIRRAEIVRSLLEAKQ